MIRSLIRLAIAVNDPDAYMRGVAVEHARNVSRAEKQARRKRRQKEREIRRDQRGRFSG